MKIEDDFRAEQLGRERAEDQDVRHVVDMYEVEALSHRTRGEDKEGGCNERRVLREIRHGSATVPLERKPEDVNAPEDLTGRFLSRFPQANELDVHAFANQCLSGSSRPHIGGIV